MKLSPVTWERWHHHLRVETILLCSWTAPGRLFHNQSTVSDYRLWRTQSRPWGLKGRLHWHYHAQQDCTKTTGSLIARAWKLMRLSHVAVCKLEPTKLWEIKFWFHPVRKKSEFTFDIFISFLTVLICLSSRCCANCAALRATKAIPTQDLHVNQMDSAWVDYLPGHEIRCK